MYVVWTLTHETYLQKKRKCIETILSVIIMSCRGGQKYVRPHGGKVVGALTLHQEDPPSLV